jgi:hypothetical protein
MMKMKMKCALLLAGLLGAGLAQAQSHSVVNYSNPPNKQADSKAATKATPGLSATAGRQDVHHTDQNIPSGKLRKAKPVKSKNSAKSSAKNGAKNGGDNATTAAPKSEAESTMQRDPSETVDSAASRHAFDKTPLNH